MKLGELLHLSLKNWFIIRLNCGPNDSFRQTAKLNRFLFLLRKPGEPSFRRQGLWKAEPRTQGGSAGRAESHSLERYH